MRRVAADCGGPAEVPTLTSQEDARTRLAALRIKSGLVPSAVAPLVAFSLQLASWRPHNAFTASVWETFKPATTQTMALLQQDVETRGRSLWKTGNTWRLTDAGIDKLVTNLINVEVVRRDETTPKPPTEPH